MKNCLLTCFIFLCLQGIPTPNDESYFKYVFGKTEYESDEEYYSRLFKRYKDESDKEYAWKITLIKKYYPDLSVWENDTYKLYESKDDEYVEETTIIKTRKGKNGKNSKIIKKTRKVKNKGNKVCIKKKINL